MLIVAIRERERERGKQRWRSQQAAPAKSWGKKSIKKPNDPDIIYIYWIASVAQLV